MSDEGFVPYAPLNVLKPIAPDVWVADGPEIRFGYLSLKLPFPTRMTVVRLPDRTLWLHSPTKPTEALIDSVQEIGPVRFLIAPNTLHYWWIPDWKSRFPDADVYAVPGLERSAKRPFPAHRTLGEAPPSVWAEAVDQVLIQGGVLTEVDFFHRPSRTLILTDLIENFELKRIRFRLVRWLVRLGGAVDPDGKAPVDLRLSFLRRREDLRNAVRRMISWEPDRIILAHGRWYDGNATAELRRAFRWVL